MEVCSAGVSNVRLSDLMTICAVVCAKKHVLCGNDVKIFRKLCFMFLDTVL